MATTYEGDMIVELPDGINAGGQGSSTIVESVTLSAERETENKHGLGNDDPTEIKRGNKSYTLDFEVHIDTSAYEGVKSLYDGDAESEAAILDDDDRIQVNIGVVVWNSIDLEASDGSDPTISVSADCRQVRF